MAPTNRQKLLQTAGCSKTPCAVLASPLSSVFWEVAVTHSLKNTTFFSVEETQVRAAICQICRLKTDHELYALKPQSFPHRNKGCTGEQGNPFDSAYLVPKLITFNCPQMPLSHTHTHYTELIFLSVHKAAGPGRVLYRDEQTGRRTVWEKLRHKQKAKKNSYISSVVNSCFDYML